MCSYICACAWACVKQISELNLITENTQQLTTPVQLLAISERERERKEDDKRENNKERVMEGRREADGK